MPTKTGTSYKTKIATSSIGIIIAIFLFFSSGQKLPVLDSKADAYFRNAIAKAGLAYTTARLMNASVSIIKDSSLQLEPAGVGMSLAIGQILDPIDDMTERLSDVLVTAITSLGVQKLAYEISISLVPPILSVFLLVLSILLWFKNERVEAFQKTLMRFTLLIMIARFCLPTSSIANDFLYKSFFEGKISGAREQLSIGSEALDKLKDFSFPEANGFFGNIKNNASFLKRKAIEFKDALASILSNMKNIIQNLLELTFLYIGIFLIQVIILPLLTFWFLMKIANSLFHTNIPIMLQHPRSSESVTAQAGN